MSRKCLSLLMAVAIFFIFPFSAFAEESRAWLVQGEVDDATKYIHINPGEKLRFSVLVYSGDSVYYKVEASNGEIRRQGYVHDANDSIQRQVINVSAGYWRVYMKCTTGRTVHRDCEAEAFVFDH